jgi:ribosomal protein S18 acetylase RimI-like enzyme
MVDGIANAGEIHRLNNLFPNEFAPLQQKHLVRGCWWLVYCRDNGSIPVAFAGMVPFDPFPRVGYLKRAAVIQQYRGRGIQQHLMDLRLREAKACTDWTRIVSECLATNVASANNFIRAGFLLCEAERPWGDPGTLFWSKDIS